MGGVRAVRNARGARARAAATFGAHLARRAGHGRRGRAARVANTRGHRVEAGRGPGRAHGPTAQPARGAEQPGAAVDVRHAVDAAGSHHVAHEPCGAALRGGAALQRRDAGVGHAALTGAAVDVGSAGHAAPEACVADAAGAHARGLARDARAAHASAANGAIARTLRVGGAVGTAPEQRRTHEPRRTLRRCATPRGRVHRSDHVGPRLGCRWNIRRDRLIGARGVSLRVGAGRGSRVTSPRRTGQHDEPHRSDPQPVHSADILKRRDTVSIRLGPRKYRSVRHERWRRLRAVFGRRHPARVSLARSRRVVDLSETARAFESHPRVSITSAMSSAPPSSPPQSSVVIPVEGALVERARRRDEAAFREIFRQHAPRVWRLLRDLLGTRAADDDATQDDLRPRARRPVALRRRTKRLSGAPPRSRAPRRDGRPRRP